MEIKYCPLIKYKLEPQDVLPVTGTTIEYETEFVGKVKITLQAIITLKENEEGFENYIFAGICKNRTIQKEEPILIDSTFINGGYKNLNPPMEFEEKCNHLLKYLYQNGGKENKEFELNNTTHFPIAYASPEEFIRIVDQLNSDYFIEIRKVLDLPRGNKNFMGVKLTKHGKKETEKSLPKMPLFNLVSQDITTGNPTIDEKINHARKLFFLEPQTMQSMRSACEELSHILEPIREDAKKYIGSSKDVEAFFFIVNEFDVRHNNNKTKHLEHPEQLEWIFYSLLNTINTYTKLKKRLGV